MKNNKSIHDIIHDRYSKIFESRKEEIEEAKKVNCWFKLKDLDISLNCFNDNPMYLQEQFGDDSKEVMVWFHSNGKVRLFCKKVNKKPDGEAYWFDEKGEMIEVNIYRDGRYVLSHTDATYLNNSKLPEWFLEECQKEKGKPITIFFGGENHVVNINDLQKFLLDKCCNELKEAHKFYPFTENIKIEDCGYCATYYIKSNKFDSRVEVSSHFVSGSVIEFDEAGFIGKFSSFCRCSEGILRDIVFFENSEVIEVKTILNGRVLSAEILKKSIANVKDEYEALKNKLTESYQVGKKIESEINSLKDDLAKNSELKKSIAKDIENLRSKCNHKFEYVGRDSHRDYERCIYCELER